MVDVGDVVEALWVAYGRARTSAKAITSACCGSFPHPHPCGRVGTPESNSVRGGFAS